jgi:hypothetical protein
MKKLFLLLISLVFAGNIYAQTKTKKAMYVNINIDWAFKDKEGNDLLGSTYIKDSIVVYNLVNGKKEKVNKPQADYPNNHFIYKDEATKTNLLRIFLEVETVLLQLNSSTTDTIKCTIKKTKGNTHIEKVWYNGKLVWTFGKAASQVITILKS